MQENNGTQFQRSMEMPPPPPPLNAVESISVPPMPAPMAEKGNSLPWQIVTIGGSAAIMLGLGMALTASAMKTAPVESDVAIIDPDDVDGVLAAYGIEGENAPAAGDAEVEVVELAAQPQLPGESMELANVSGNLSFGQAFAAARDMVGEGGVFVWHGNIYATYYTEEWAALNEAEQAAFAERAVAEYGDVAAMSRVEMPAAPAHEAVPQDIASDSAALQEAEVHIIGMKSIVQEDGEIDQVMVGEYRGRQVQLWDIDADGTPDAAVADFDGNGSIDNDDVIDLATGQPFGAAEEAAGEADAQAEADSSYGLDDGMPGVGDYDSAGADMADGYVPGAESSLF